MPDLEPLKQYREIKEIKDIKQDIDKLDSLIRENAWDTVNTYLQDLSWKYMKDRIENGYVSFELPPSVEQSAANCRQFLVWLKEKKIAEEALKQHGGNEDVH